MPSAAELPSFDAVEMETPTPVNVLGAKGIGESGTIGATPAVQSAVSDKLYTSITSKIDFDALARQVLPDRADILAPAIATGVQTTIRNQIRSTSASWAC